MKAIDRIMAAYTKVHKLTDEQADTVRKELSFFVTQLLATANVARLPADLSDIDRSKREPPVE
jgi:hypothetical protein